MPGPDCSASDPSMGAAAGSLTPSHRERTVTEGSASLAHLDRRMVQPLPPPPPPPPPLAAGSGIGVDEPPGLPGNQQGTGRQDGVGRLDQDPNDPQGHLRQGLGHDQEGGVDHGCRGGGPPSLLPCPVPLGSGSRVDLDGQPPPRCRPLERIRVRPAQNHIPGVDVCRSVAQVQHAPLPQLELEGGVGGEGIVPAQDGAIGVAAAASSPAAVAEASVPLQEGAAVGRPVRAVLHLRRSLLLLLLLLLPSVLLPPGRREQGGQPPHGPALLLRRFPVPPQRVEGPDHGWSPGTGIAAPPAEVGGGGGGSGGGGGGARHGRGDGQSRRRRRRLAGPGSSSGRRGRDPPVRRRAAWAGGTARPRPRPRPPGPQPPAAGPRQPRRAVEEDSEEYRRRDQGQGAVPPRP